MDTKQNLELKHRCDDFTQIRTVLADIGARKETVKQQKDYFFHLPKERIASGARMKLRTEEGVMSLVYYERPDFTADSDTSADIALLPAGETTLEFFKIALGILAVVEKEREVWRKDHTVFHLDNIKEVGMIFEIEVQCASKATEMDRKLFADCQSRLAPLLGEVVTGSNVDLVLSATNKKPE